MEDSELMMEEEVVVVVEGERVTGDRPSGATTTISNDSEKEKGDLHQQRQSCSESIIHAQRRTDPRVWSDPTRWYDPDV